MQNFLLISQITLSVFITVCILLQAQGSGLGRTWGGTLGLGVGLGG